MKRAILSDIHGNLEALDAVLEDIKTQGITVIHCLGDIIGYGPNPLDCIDRALSFDNCILGNHDQAALFDPEGFSSGAQKAIFWTRQQLETGASDSAATLKRWNFLAELPWCRNFPEENVMYVHGSARNPLNEYVFPEDIHNSTKMEKIFALVHQTCFQGHTHIPGVFTEQLKFFSPDDLKQTYQLDQEKVLINVGSVGQPRDGQSAASYVVLEDDQLEFRRVEYDLEATVKKIYEIPDLEDFLGDRLREGR